MVIYEVYFHIETLDYILISVIALFTFFVGILPSLKILKKKKEVEKIKKLINGKWRLIEAHTVLEENTDLLRKFIFFISLFIISLYIWEGYRVNSQIVQEKVRSDSSKKSLDSEINSLKYMIDTSFEDPVLKVKNGFSVSGILTIKSDTSHRRKFIFDTGESLYKNRISLYLDPGDNLILRLIDNNGETFSVTRKINFITFKINARYFIYCDVGTSENYSFMRIFLDDREVARQNFNSSINIKSEEDFKGISLGSDIEGENNGNFEMSFLSIGELLPKKKRVDLMNIMIGFRSSVESNK
jgi:hypothetical protein